CPGRSLPSWGQREARTTATVTTPMWSRSSAARAIATETTPRSRKRLPRCRRPASKRRSTKPPHPRHWRLWLPASRAYRGSTDELRSLRARWVARANGVLGGILARESFVLSQAFYLGGIEGQPPIKVIPTVGARIDLCDDLDEGAIFKNG